MADLVQDLHMTGGRGETSYASNSLLQMKAIEKARPMVVQALTELYCSLLPKRITVADLGCSSGPNALVVVDEVVEIVRAASDRLGLPPAEIQYHLNDLPGNDFNTLFGYVTSFQDKLERDCLEGRQMKKVALYPSVVAGSFYGRLFQSNSVHFVHSSYSLHFLSQVPRGVGCDEFGNPTNRQDIYISPSSPHPVYQSYLLQFQHDFTSFLQLRSEEIVTGGCMVLVFFGRGDLEPFNGVCSHLWKLLVNVLVEMASEGLIEEAKVDSFNLPIYCPSVEELTRVICSQGSFHVAQYECFQLDCDPTKLEEGAPPEGYSTSSSGENVAKFVRAVMESMLRAHFGEALCADDLFSRFAGKVDEGYLSKHDTKFFHHSVVLRKNGDSPAS